MIGDHDHVCFAVTTQDIEERRERRKSTLAYVIFVDQCSYTIENWAHQKIPEVH